MPGIRSRGAGWSVVVSSGISRTSIRWPARCPSTITGAPSRSLRSMGRSRDVHDDPVPDPPPAPGGVEAIAVDGQPDRDADLEDVAPRDPVQSPAGRPAA